MLFDGLNAFWKTWLQLAFPFYTAGLFIIGLHYSRVLARLFGDRSVSVLATLLFLSYTKLLHTIITAISLDKLTTYPSSETQFVWAVDGNLEYGNVYKMIALCVTVSIAIVFIQFRGIALWNLLQICLRCRKQNGKQGDNGRQDRMCNNKI